MSALKDYQDKKNDDLEVDVDAKAYNLKEVAEGGQMQLPLSRSAENALITLQNAIRGDVKIGRVVAIAIELLLVAKGHEIRLIDRKTGKEIDSFYFWK